MTKQPRQPSGKPKVRTEAPDRAAAAARDPDSGAKNRPGFDLGGAVGDAKPDQRDHARNSTIQGRDAAGIRATGKVQSAIAGVKNWLRRK
ncbi:hypothetical protein [Bradyrhizobium sp.]|uniref:hypothetical protein n=1 Tax=Bradyrhizobium sp. TaxID=376 RepID=UPI0025BDB7BB|nr:hypothetical protein [Bradyrhizobium sp.]